MGLFSNNNPNVKDHGILSFSVDVIKWEPQNDAEASIIAHKHVYEDFPDGSHLIVGPSQVAIFTNHLTESNSMNSGGQGQSQMLTFIGPCKIKLDTGDSRWAIIRNVKNNLLSGGESAFHSTVYFLNTTYMNELSWGTQAPIVVEDPDEEVNVHVRAFGLFGAHIDTIDEANVVINARRFLQKVVGTRGDYTRDELKDFMRARILEYVPDLLAKNMVDKGVGILKISTHLSEFSQIISEKLRDHFADFGLSLDNFSFTNINAPDEDLQMINEMKQQKKAARLLAEGNAAAMDIESEALARKRQREGYTYQQEQGFGVMQAAAENEGSSGHLMGMGMGMGMGVGMGGAFGMGMSQIAQNTMGNMGLGNMQPMTQGTGIPGIPQGGGMPVPPLDESARALLRGQSGQAGEVICPACGTKNPADAKFCSACGTPMEPQKPQVKSCPSCGREIPADGKFCPYCGAKMQVELSCKTCGRKLEPDAKFCLECGTPVG